MEPNTPETSNPSADPQPGEAKGAEVSAALGLGGSDAKPAPKLKKKHLVILAGLALAAAAGMFVYGQFSAGKATRTAVAEPETPANTPPASPLAEKPALPAAPAAAERPESAGASWPLAEQAYEATHYAEALKSYNSLLRESDKNPVNRRISGLIRLRAGRCLVHLNRTREARPMFQEAADCGSPVVRAVACYDLGNLDVAEGQPMTARLRAYQGLASLGEAGLRPRLEMQLEFLAAQAITTRALSFANADAGRQWSIPPGVDPFAGLNEAELKKLLDDGVARQASTLLGAKLERKAGSRGMHLWTAVSCGEPLEDLIGRVVTQSGMDVRWENVGDAARRRPVVLSLDGVNDNRLIEVLCGAAGLVARFTGKEVVVCDGQAYTSVADVKDLTVRESISLWRRFFMRASDSPSLASGHYAMGLLQELAGDGAAAMAEYQVVAREYPMNTLAPVARRHAAAILIDLRDYKGAREALLDLLNHYPDCPAIEEVYLRLGQATMEAGNLDEAAATFKKLFFLELTPASKAAAALGAAKANFRKGKYDDAAMWIGHRLELPRSPATDGDLAEAYGLQAGTEAARRRLPEAVRAYKQALAFMPQDGRQVEMLLELVKILVQQEDFVAAYSILEKLRPQNLAPPQADEILIAKADVLYAMGLADQAVAVVKIRLPLAASPEAAARMTILMAKGMADTGDLEGARAKLADLVPRLEPGPLAHRAAIELARICMRGGRNPQAIALCSDLLKSSCSEDIRQAARDVLSRAYRLEKNYERAVVVLSEAETPPKGAAKP